MKLLAIYLLAALCAHASTSVEILEGRPRKDIPLAKSSSNIDYIRSPAVVAQIENLIAVWSSEDSRLFSNADRTIIEVYYFGIAPDLLETVQAKTLMARAGMGKQLYATIKTEEEYQQVKEAGWVYYGHRFTPSGAAGLILQFEPSLFDILPRNNLEWPVTPDLYSKWLMKKLSTMNGHKAAYDFLVQEHLAWELNSSPIREVKLIKELIVRNMDARYTAWRVEQLATQTP